MHMRRPPGEAERRPLICRFQGLLELEADALAAAEREAAEAAEAEAKAIAKAAAEQEAKEKAEIEAAKEAEEKAIRDTMDADLAELLVSLNLLVEAGPILTKEAGVKNIDDLNELTVEDLMSVGLSATTSSKLQDTGLKIQASIKSSTADMGKAILKGFEEAASATAKVFEQRPKTPPAPID